MRSFFDVRSSGALANEEGLASQSTIADAATPAAAIAAAAEAASADASTHIIEHQPPRLDTGPVAIVPFHYDPPPYRRWPTSFETAPANNEPEERTISPLPRRRSTRTTLSPSLSILRVSDRRASDRQRVLDLEESRRQQAEAERQIRAEVEAQILRESLEAEQRALAEAEDRSRRGHRAAPAPGQSLIPPLGAEWEDKVAEAMHSAPGRTLATTSTGTILTRRDFGTLLPQSSADGVSGWLNDDIIMGYIQAVVDYGLAKTNHRRGQTPKYHVFASFFFSNLKINGPQSVRRWASRAKIDGKNLREVEYLFLPINQASHWTLCVVSPRHKTVEYFDSLGGTGEAELALVRDWLEMELGEAFAAEEWAIRTAVSPRQDNMRDCGVFTATTAKMVLLGWDPEKAYGAADMPLQRRRMAAELMAGRFGETFAPAEPVASQGR
jgi:Ulp1 family protease